MVCATDPQILGTTVFRATWHMGVSLVCTSETLYSRECRLFTISYTEVILNILHLASDRSFVPSMVEKKLIFPRSELSYLHAPQDSIRHYGRPYFRDVASQRVDRERPQVVTGPVTVVIGVCLEVSNVDL